MFRNIKFIKKIIERCCNKEGMRKMSCEISENNMKLQSINELQNKLQQYIESKSIEDLLGFSMEKVYNHNLAYHEIENIKKLPCKLNLDVYEINVNQSKYKL